LSGFAKRRNIVLTLLSDSNSAMIEAFDVLNETSAWAAGIAHPIIFVTDPNGVITHRFSRWDYSVRPEIDDVLRALKN
jgi:peroxiredoxin